MAKPSEAERSQFYTEVAAATSPRTAEILVHEVLEVQWDDLVNKSDLRGDVAGLRGEFTDLRGEFSVLKGEFADLRGEFSVLKGEFADLRGEFADLRGEFSDLRSDVQVGFANVDAKLEKQFRQLLLWLMSTIIAVAAILVAVLPHL